MPSKQIILPFLPVMCLMLFACGSGSGKSFVPIIPGYSDKQKQVTLLDKNLLEISGIAYINDSIMAALNDEKGILFFLNLKTKAVVTTEFKGKGDYEELVKTDSGFYVLNSDGEIHELDIKGNLLASYKLKRKGKIEFESMVWYRKENKMVLITKEQRKKMQAISAFSFDMTSKTFDPEPFFDISFKEVYIKLENYNTECKPSGAAINPKNNRLYIIASIGKMMLECTREGKLIRIYKLNPSHFPQPEGITFATNGDMYISNEGLEGKATILKYPYVATK